MRRSLAKQTQQFLDHLTVERGLSGHTVAAYRRDLARYTAFLGKRGIRDGRRVDEASVRAFAAHFSSLHREDGSRYHVSSVSRALSSVRSFHEFLLREGEADTNPATGVARPKLPRSLPRPLTVEDAEHLLAAPEEQTAAGLRDRAALEILYGAGLRVSELAGLDVDDVDLEEGSVRVLGKGAKERLVPLGSLAQEAVSAYLTRARPSLSTGRSRGALLLNLRGGRLTRQGVTRLLKLHAARAGIGRNVTPHTLRHSFATHLLDGGADVRVVQELLGHASVATTQIYTLVTKEHLREAYLTAHPRARRTVPTGRG